MASTKWTRKFEEVDCGEYREAVKGSMSGISLRKYALNSLPYGILICSAKYYMQLFVSGAHSQGQLLLRQFQTCEQGELNAQLQVQNHT